MVIFETRRVARAGKFQEGIHAWFLSNLQQPGDALGGAQQLNRSNRSNLIHNESLIS